MAKALVLALAGMITAVLLLCQGLKAWIPWLTRHLLRIAIVRLPEDQRERFSEEWASHINEVTGEISRVAIALGYIFASPQMASLLKSGEPSRFYRARDDHEQSRKENQSEQRTSDVEKPLAQAIKLSSVSPIMLADKDFRRRITLKREESLRSRKPFMLLLLDMGVDMASERNGRILEKIAPALCASARDTDVTGWYSKDCVVGVMFTEIAIKEGRYVPITIITRITKALQANLTLEQFNRVTLSFHVFPEGWDHEEPNGSSNSPLYPDLSQSDEGRKALRIVKRVMDIVGSSLALVFLAPIFLAVACVVKATSKGPVLLRQRRIGQYGNSFVFLKFRSMYVDNDADVHKKYVQQLIAGKADKQPSNGNGQGVYKLTKDSRITSVGAFLRKTSLDELPQFFNVLTGEMSLVGPRPPVPYEVEAYDIWHRRRLLEVKPGITGLWRRHDPRLREDTHKSVPRPSAPQGNSVRLFNWGIRHPVFAGLMLILLWAALVLMLLVSGSSR